MNNKLLCLVLTLVGLTKFAAANDPLFFGQKFLRSENYTVVKNCLESAGLNEKKARGYAVRTTSKFLIDIMEKVLKNAPTESGDLSYDFKKHFILTSLTCTVENLEEIMKKKDPSVEIDHDKPKGNPPMKATLNYTLQANCVTSSVPCVEPEILTAAKLKLGNELKESVSVTDIIYNRVGLSTGFPMDNDAVKAIETQELDFFQKINPILTAEKLKIDEQMTQKKVIERGNIDYD